VTPGDVQMDQSETDAAETLQQLEKVVSEFMITYPSHTQRIPLVRPSENMMISFVRSLFASMASKQDELELRFFSPSITKPFPRRTKILKFRSTGKKFRPMDRSFMSAEKPEFFLSKTSR
jgi:hypothetical protein